MAQLNKYTVNGRTGHGYLIDLFGIKQHSIAWEDGPATRHKDDELRELAIKCEHVKTSAPAETIRKTTVAELEAEREVKQEANESKEIEPALPEFVFNPNEPEAANIRNYLTSFPEADNREVIAALHDLGMEVSSGQVTYQRNRLNPEE